MDYTSVRTKHRAEHLARDAAAASHASYYAHPALHVHTYLNKSTPAVITQEGNIVGALNDPVQPLAQSSAPEASDEAPPTGAPTDPGEHVHNIPRVNANTDEARKVGIEGTKEEEGGKEDAGVPSGMDKGALEIGGEAGGTKTSPGPTAEEVAKYTPMISDRTNGALLGLPNGRPDMERHLSVSGGMQPHLQLMCGPLLAYYTVKDNIWQGAAMVVIRDEGSVLDRPPYLNLSFHPYTPPSAEKPTLHDPEVQLLPPTTFGSQKIFTYASPEGNMSFHRFIMEIPLQTVQMTARYRLNGGAEMDFVVPALGQNMRWAAHSCNGFSSGVNPDDFKGPYPSGYDPVWEDLLLKHQEKAFHCMVGGGDQIYCDAVTREPELQSWINESTRKSKLGHPLTDDMRIAIDRFYFNHYCKIFRSNAFGRANSTIPMVNMLDDHDLIDGFGTYDDETQSAPVMSFVGSRGYFWFLLFQLFTCDAFDGVNPVPGTHVIKSLIIGDKNGPWIPFPSHSLLVYLGPKVTLLALDCRAERKFSQICRPESYSKVFNEVKKLQGIEQLVILLGVPIAYPRMSFLEHFLGLKWNPINVLARHNALGLGSMVNKFNQSSELLDDLNDHWCANTHKQERNWLVLECQELAKQMHARITFLSGDVHLAAVGCLFSKKKKGEKALNPEQDWRYMMNVITSAIVNTPPPAGAAKMVAMLGGHKHRTLHKDTDEHMMPLFDKDTDGSTLSRTFVQPRRNYTIVEYTPQSELIFDIRVEKSQGAGETVGYRVTAPAPRW
ncbi:plasma membrane protein [Cryptococcus deuterogattii 99/473]|uniref:Plasma membrane protein n=1 Tax=Cryptococcus deuterogattii Ram5 TaxID=1296110 RepID=A0A0D0T1P7_9TREE|nr:plasma membrane protein [Cryptococcus deuterogattii Ram5]KIY59222.1 plasma membrane protein [Cryptococcus deuterogattii 99/473]